MQPQALVGFSTFALEPIGSYDGDTRRLLHVVAKLEDIHSASPPVRQAGLHVHMNRITAEVYWHLYGDRSRTDCLRYRVDFGCLGWSDSSRRSRIHADYSLHIFAFNLDKKPRIFRGANP